MASRGLDGGTTTPGSGASCRAAHPIAPGRARTLPRTAKPATSLESGMRAPPIATFEEYVLVTQDERRIEAYRCRDGAWLCETAGAGGSVVVHGTTIAIDDG